MAQSKSTMALPLFAAMFLLPMAAPLPALDAQVERVTKNISPAGDSGGGASGELGASALLGASGPYGFLESLPAAGLFLFHANDVSSFLPGITDPDGGRDPVLFDPRTGVLTALFAPGGSTPGGELRATFAADGLNFLLRATGGVLVPGLTDGNGPGADLYAGNRKTGVLQLISSSGASAATSANQGVTENIVYSANGRFVAYGTLATDAVAGMTDTNGVEDIVLHDRQLGTRVLVSRSASSPAQTANAQSFPTAISSDGEVLIFSSLASNLIAGFADPNPNVTDYFLYRRGAGVTSLVNHSVFSASTAATGGAGFGKLSADGRFFVFASGAGNLVKATTNGANTDTFLYDTATGVNSLVSHRPFFPFYGVDDNVYPDLISADGRFIVLRSPDTLLVDGATYPPFATSTVLYDRPQQRATLISHPPGQPLSGLGGYSQGLALSDDGRFVVFASEAPNVVPGQTGQPTNPVRNIYLADRATGESTLLSRSLNGPRDTGNQHSSSPALGPGGWQVLFLSQATNLTLHPAFGLDVYLADLTAGGSELFRDGFELGDTSLWSATQSFAGSQSVGLN